MGFFLGLVLALVVLVTVNKLWCFWCRSKVCLVGKTALITGGASGIGFQTALALASKGCKIIIADVANLSVAVEEIKKITHNPNITGKTVDLQSFKSVREFAKDIVNSEPQLHILACNAGILSHGETRLTEDGLDKVMQVNYFSHFLLTHLLLDLLKQSAPSRIIFTSSQIAYTSGLTIETLNPKPVYPERFLTKIKGGVYGNSKLCMAGAAKLFGSKLKGTRVTANVVHPGGMQTPLYWNAIRQHKSYFSFIGVYFGHLYGKTPEEGAQTLIHLAHSDEVENVTGESFIEGMRFPRPAQLTDEFCNKLWDASVEFTRLQPHEIKC